MKAEEIAEEEFGIDFYSLPQDKQMEVYQRGLDHWTDARMAEADYWNDKAREEK